MASWNPYYGIPTPAEYEDHPDVGFPNYYNLPNMPSFASVPVHVLECSGVFDHMPTYGRNIHGTMFNVQDLEAAQRNQLQPDIFPVQLPPDANVGNYLANDLDPSKIHSKLTPTAVEFKPSSSSHTPDHHRYDGRTKRYENSSNRGAIRRTTPRSSNQNFPPPTTDQDRSSVERPDETTRKYKNSKQYNNATSNAEKYQKNRYENNVGSGRTFNKNHSLPNSARGSRYDKDDNNAYYNSTKSENRFGNYENRNHSSRNYENSNRNANAKDRNTFRDNRQNQRYRGNNRYDTTYENWRSSDTDKNKSVKVPKVKAEERKVTKDMIKTDTKIQRDRLTEEVNHGTLECLVCCERVRQVDKIWHCNNCFHILHLRCIMKWAETSKDENGWRCPACQHVCLDVPSGYFCYCGKVYDPAYVPGDTAHGCGDMCGRIGQKSSCVHRCNLLCHPGPCPKCETIVSRKCNCGATTQMVKCSATTVLVCTSICNKKLNCDVHSCDKICHGNACNPCTEVIEQECFCGKSNRTLPCDKIQHGVKHYSCDKPCYKQLLCGNHTCNELCHPGECPPCIRSPTEVKSCPCGKEPLKTPRTSCLDPILSCNKVCGKRYPLCGTPSEPHLCKSICHEGDCPPCDLSSFVRCRCGHMSCEISCAELTARPDDARCKKKCTKKRSCAKHKCNQLCCIDIDHICPLPCNHVLSCGQHRCEQTCHKGRCPPCWRTSFEELYCECGESVLYPPIQCGTKRPPCTRPCLRTHNCNHEALHTCHSQPDCPPCTVLTAKICYGGHEKRSTIPCHQAEFSCGLPCGKELPCGRHKCQLPCHKGVCLKEGQNCMQSCTATRDACGHACGLPCHQPPCPESPCKELVKVTCECGLRSSSRACVDMTGEYQRIATSMLASKMADMQLGHSIDIADIVGATARKQTLKTLECNEECRLIERNRRLAIGLQIRNPDLSAKLTPRYSDFMRQWTKKDTHFCQMVHDRLTELVQLAKQSKQKSRSYSFPSMNREKRQFVHEYCEHFGCESAAYDQEPNRNVVATAVKDKAWLPSCSLLELLQRENGQRKVPGPILNRPLGAASKVSSSVSLKFTSSVKPGTSTSFSSTRQQTSTTPESEVVDYFNAPPQPSSNKNN